MLLVAHRTPTTAFDCAGLAAAGASVFELDVQLVDGRLVVSHFLPVLRRRGWLENDSWRFRWTGRGTPDRSVQDMAGLVPDHCGIALDLKEGEPGRRAELKQRLMVEIRDTDRYRVSSGDPADLAQFRAAGFRTWRTIGGKRDLERVMGEGQLADEAVSVRHRLLSREYVDRLHAVVPTIIAWTVNDVGRARALREMGVDGLTTDNRNVLVRVHLATRT